MDNHPQCFCRTTAFSCIDCGRDTNDEYYMVWDHIWKKANPDMEGMLCISCIEERLGRELTWRDFTTAPLNQLSYDYPRSARLIDRLTRTQTIIWMKNSDFTPESG